MNEQVYAACSKIPVGKVTTYKFIAEAIGRPKAYRAVATILSKNPNAPIVPCHRVIGTDRTLKGYKGSSDISEKKRMLMDEGVKFDDKDRVLKEYITDVAVKYDNLPQQL